MAMMKKSPVFWCSLAVMGALAFPVSNLLIPRAVRQDSPIVKAFPPSDAKVAHIFETKCLDCHSTHTQYPWYFSLPIAGDVIRQDVQAGLGAMDLDQVFGNTDGGKKPVSMVQLNEIEYAIAHDLMPLMKYKALHWNAFLSSQEKHALLSWVHAERSRQVVQGTAPQFAGEPLQPLTPIAFDSQKAALGSKLFHETLLSKDNTLSCASCHGLDKGGTDRARFSTGVGGARGHINSPTVFNAALNVKQFWDGRAVDLVEQAAGPVVNPIEMASQWPDVVAKIKENPQYASRFQALYRDGVTQRNIQDAIAEFEKTLITTGSRFDRYLMGDAKALNDQEKAGYEVFKKVGCASCHLGPAVGGTHFRKMGVVRDYFAARGDDLSKEDNGRFNVTHANPDRFSFKVPTLRNIALTGPYFHDGTAKTLDEAVDKMARYQLGVTLSPVQREQVVQFLNTLNGEYQGKPLQ